MDLMEKTQLDFAIAKGVTIRAACRHCFKGETYVEGGLAVSTFERHNQYSVKSSPKEMSER